MAVERYKGKTRLSPNDYAVSEVYFDTEAKKIISFCVLQVYSSKEKNYEIIKFDTAHDFVHVHRFYQRPNHEGENLNKEISPETFEECKKEIKNNWQKYRQWYLSKLEPG